VTVRPVTVAMFQTVPVAAQTIFPVPNAKVRVMAFELSKTPQDSVNPLRSRMSPATPALKKNVRVEPIVKLAASCTVDATLSETVTGQSMVTPAELIVRVAPPPAWF